MTCHIFAGQGSQIPDTALSILKKYPEYSKKACEVLGYNFQELLEDKSNQKINQTQYTQPFVFTMNTLLYIDKFAQHSIELPSFMAGHSLGEYNALLVAGVFDFETALRIIKERSELMSKVNNGSMAAIIGLNESEIENIVKKEFKNIIDLANYNSPQQIVISGSTKAIDQGEKVFLEHGAKNYIKLKVSGAFHSHYMKDTSAPFLTFLRRFSFNKPRIPVISNVTGLPYSDDNKKIPELLAKQLYLPVQWQKSIEYMLDQGELEFVEISQKSVLMNLINQTKHKYRKV